MTDTALIVHINGLELAEEIDRHEVERAVLASAAANGVEAGELSVTFCTEGEITSLNRRYLGVDGPTDVIAFNLDETKRPLGDVYVCPAVGRRAAVQLAVAVREELLRLVVHGVLHVLGYDHPQGAERAESEMFRLQEEIVSRLTRS